MSVIKNYRYAIIFALGLCGLYLHQPEAGVKALLISLGDGKIILGILPPVLILVGLLDVWMPKATVIRFMGENSGVKGLMFAFILGAVAAGPLFVAFPIAAMLAAKGARLANILFFIGIWTSAKLPMVLFEVTFFGKEFTAIHVLVGSVMFLIGSLVIEKITPEESLAILKATAESK